MKLNSKITKFVAVFMMAILLVGCTSSSSNSNSSSSGSSTSSSSSSTKTFTADEVAKSSSRTDCKMIINGKVYDVTPYINSHPGGADILQGCGKDATALFTGTDPNGRDHSSDAERTLQRYYVGDLAK